MSLIYYKTSAALFIFLISIAAVVYPLRRKSGIHHSESVEIGEALASGIFLGAAFFHMLPDAIRLFSDLYGSHSYPIAEAICVGSFLLLLFLERLSLASKTLNSKNTIPYLLALILIIHAITEGAALGVGTTFSETLMLFIAIAVHKGSESFALCMTMIKHKLPMPRVWGIMILFALMTPLGISLGAGLTFGQHGELIAAIFNAFAAGTFFYISTLHHVHFHQHTHDSQGLLEFGCLALGLATMGVIAIWA